MLKKTDLSINTNLCWVRERSLVKTSHRSGCLSIIPVVVIGYCPTARSFIGYDSGVGGLSAL